MPLHNIDRYAVMGNPIEHSLSPQIHQAFAQQFGEQISYEKILVPVEGLRTAVQEFKIQGGKGLNITLPFKEEAWHVVDEHSEAAKLAKAVNTIMIRGDGSLRGDNTDGLGLVRDLTQNQKIKIKIENKNILILGAGGAVHGILGPLLEQQPQQIFIANRTLDKALQLEEEFKNLGLLQGVSLETIPRLSFDLIINGTSLSLQEEELPFPTRIIHPHTICYDLAYNKTGLTRFQAWAQQEGAAKSFSGWGMLVEQAAQAYFLWRGKQPDTAGGGSPSFDISRVISPTGKITREFF